MEEEARAEWGKVSAGGSDILQTMVPQQAEEASLGTGDVSWVLKDV